VSVDLSQNALLTLNGCSNDQLVRFEFDEIKAAIEFDRTGSFLVITYNVLYLPTPSCYSRVQRRMEVPLHDAGK
jgi:hypothetical protein